VLPTVEDAMGSYLGAGNGILKLAAIFGAAAAWFNASSGRWSRQWRRRVEVGAKLTAIVSLFGRPFLIIIWVSLDERKINSWPT
jgi:hypothetical protein